MDVRYSDGGDNVVIFVPIQVKKWGGRKRIIYEQPVGSPDRVTDDTLIAMIKKAVDWQHKLDTGEFQSIREMSFREGVDDSYISKVLRLSLLAPDIIEAILLGVQPSGFSIAKARKYVPLLWEEQRRYFGFEAAE